MREHVPSLYRLPPLQQLVAAEAAAVQDRMRAYAGGHGLQLGVLAEDPPPHLPLLRHWVQLHVHQGRYLGDLQLAPGEALPFHDGALDVLWLKHVLDLWSEPAPLLEEAARLLAPGGVLVLSGLHFFGRWTWCRPRNPQEPRIYFHMPWKLRQLVRRAGLVVETGWRESASALPSGGRGSPLSWGGAYMLIARKASDQAALTRLRPKRLKPVGVHAAAPS